MGAQHADLGGRYSRRPQTLHMTQLLCRTVTPRCRSHISEPEGYKGSALEVFLALFSYAPPTLSFPDGFLHLSVQYLTKHCQPTMPETTPDPQTSPAGDKALSENFSMESLEISEAETDNPPTPEPVPYSSLLKAFFNWLCPHCRIILDSTNHEE